jgi:hypothetical protein
MNPSLWSVADDERLPRRSPSQLQLCSIPPSRRAHLAGRDAARVPSQARRTFTLPFNTRRPVVFPVACWRRHHCPTRPTADHPAAATLALATSWPVNERRLRLQGIRPAWMTEKCGGRQQRGRVNRFGSGRKRKEGPEERVGIRCQAL